jgi:hypothetical protein
MKRELKIFFALLFAACAASSVQAADGDGLPQTVSGYEGWHGAHIDRHAVPMCELILPRSFGQTPDEFRLLVEMVRHGWDVGNDQDCAMQMAPEAAWKRILQLAVEDQDSEAAKLIVGAMGHTEQLGLDSDDVATFGERYLYPLLLRYHDLAGLVPKQQEGNVARDVCMTYFSPRTSENLDLDGIRRRLRQQRMVSLLRKVDRTCAYMQKRSQG